MTTYAIDDDGIMEDIENLMDNIAQGSGVIYAVCDSKLSIKRRKEYILILKSQNFIDINYVHSDGTTALLAACRLDSIPLVKFLLDEFPEIKVQNNDINDNELLDPLIYCMKENKNPHIIKLLLDRVNIKEYVLQISGELVPYPFIMELFSYFINTKGNLPPSEQVLHSIDVELINIIISSDKLSVLLNNRYKEYFYMLLNTVHENNKPIGALLITELIYHMDTFYGIEELCFAISNYSDDIFGKALLRNFMIKSMYDVLNSKITLDYHLSKYPERQFCFSQDFLKRAMAIHSPMHTIIDILSPDKQSLNVIKEMIRIDRKILKIKTTFIFNNGNKKIEIPLTTPLEFAILLYHKTLCNCHKNPSTYILYKKILFLIKLGAGIKISKLAMGIVKQDKDFKHYNLLKLFAMRGSYVATKYYKKTKCEYCVHCGEEANYLCGGCGAIKYCSHTCQANNWKWHKKCCAKFKM